MARGASRGEYPSVPIAREGSRLTIPPRRPSGSRPATALEPLRSAAPSGRRPEADVPWVELEKAITARVERRLDQKIAATIRDTLGADTEIARAMRDGVYDALHDRMVLERERRG